LYAFAAVEEDEQAREVFRRQMELQEPVINLRLEELREEAVDELQMRPHGVLQVASSDSRSTAGIFGIKRNKFVVKTSISFANCFSVE
jgi:hypothetical protein